MTTVSCLPNTCLICHKTLFYQFLFLNMMFQEQDPVITFICIPIPWHSLCMNAVFCYQLSMKSSNRKVWSGWESCLGSRLTCFNQKNIIKLCNGGIKKNLKKYNCQLPYAVVKTMVEKSLKLCQIDSTSTKNNKMHFVRLFCKKSFWFLWLWLIC